MKVEFIHCTPDAEKLIAYCARVSSTKQDNPEYEKLIKYLIENKHWSPLEMATMCVEIETTRGIAPQILRHRSFYFQEFSQRYQQVNDFEKYEARRQDLKNRQNSINDMDDKDIIWFDVAQEKIWNESKTLYDEALKRGVAKEQARFLLPLNTKTKLYMHGTLRNWVHYIELRSANGTQKEHQEIALECKRIFIEQFPTIAKALVWSL